MSVKKHFHIAVLGNIASGKTTVSKYLAKELKAPLVDADLFEENPFLPMYVNDRPRWSFATELFFTKARLKKLASVKELLKKGSVIVDSGILMSCWIYARNHLKQGTMTASEWQFYLDLTEDIKKNSYDGDEDLVVVLKAQPRVLLERIATRGRDFEKAYDQVYLYQLSDRLNELVEKLKSEEKHVLEFDTGKYDMLTEPRNFKKFLKEVIDKLKELKK